MLVRHILPKALQRLVTVQASDDLTQVAMMLSLEHINGLCRKPFMELRGNPFEGWR